MKIKPSYKDRMRELFSFGDDLENWELQTTFSDFVAEFVEFSGNEAEEIRTRITPIRARRGQVRFKEEYLSNLTQYTFEADPIGITEKSNTFLTHFYYEEPDIKWGLRSTYGDKFYSGYSFYPVIKLLKGLSYEFNISGKSINSIQKSINKLIENKSFIFNECPKEYAYSNSDEEYFDRDGAAVFKGFTLEEEN